MLKSDCWKSDFAKKADLASLKSDIDKLGIDELEQVPSGLNNLKIKVDKLVSDRLKHIPFDFSKLSNIVEEDVVKKTEYDELVKNVNATDTSEPV